MRELERFIQERVESTPMPGLACAVVVDDGIAWAKGFGWADIERGMPMTADTI